MFSSAIQRLNDRRSAAGETGEDAGFTLIELMVVLLILAILLAIAIPTFLGVTKSANDRAAQSNLNTALLNAKAQYQQNSQAYPTSANLVTALQSAEPSLHIHDWQRLPTRTTSRCSRLRTARPWFWLSIRHRPRTAGSIVDTPTHRQTAALAPFAAAQAPTVAAGTELQPGGCRPHVAFVDTTLGPTYAEIKSESDRERDDYAAAACIASAARAVAGTATSSPTRPSQRPSDREPDIRIAGLVRLSEIN